MKEFTIVPIDREPAPATFLITGIPGSGKSTVARALAQRFELGAHIEVDRLQEFIVSGGRWPGPEPEEEADRQLFLRARNAALLADSYVDAGVVPVIDDVVVLRPHLDFYRKAVSRTPLTLIVLAPAPEVTTRRNRERDKTLVEDWSFLDEAMRGQIPDEGVWIDNAELTVDQTVDEILRITGIGGGKGRVPTTT
ncbi:AAA family ATPase [Marinactinospora thermotolerans]|uniref:AAA domain-containing protein n=2 Tax=Marinactinospora thermotolerans TaxID=531310 RepID=A0A1T4T4M0_9ACTN|nr:AAA family ATPase [Marinactinospora thermotolerans]AET51860.1 phosphotransferase [Marinactinospora thermotolerans]SKA35191.1 AAA domain-containing protein [Marinactinospora thermotolerans DSM 45154]